MLKVEYTTLSLVKYVNTKILRKVAKKFKFFHKKGLIKFVALYVNT